MSRASGSGFPPAAPGGRRTGFLRGFGAKGANKGGWLGVFGLLSAWIAGSACASRGGPAPELRHLDRGATRESADLEYRILLPPGYPAGAPYPVLYFLHDYFGGSGTLWRRGVAAELAERMRDGRLAPMVVVSPEGGRGYWSDSWDGSRRYETLVTGALREEVERRFAVRRDRAGRAITGISMGGFGAIKAAARRPELYAAASSLSGALLNLEPETVASYPFWTQRQLTRIFGPVNDPRSTWAANDPRDLLAAADPRALPEMLLLCGSEDEYDLDGLQLDFAAFARARGVEIASELEPGGHDWDYWRRSVVEIVEWHAARFAEEAAPR